ncbi:ATP-binding protein [Polluticaenibacter yanchengensis]|uniref:histidine kinase n=1 Tax=Polluticaenibacter yanchengensis TaxID=3014562 RepID=A0ABT4UG04_9BACT|nr:ATP-binding protein [Chitinophagaceae bacterium LY-5]
MNRYIFFIFLLLSCQNAINIDTKPPETVNADNNKKYNEYYKRAQQLINVRNDSAFYYLYEFTENTNDTLLLAYATIQMGAIQNDAGDYLGSIESLLKGIPFLDEKNAEHQEYLSSIYNELAISCKNLKHFDEAIRYFNLAIQYSNDSTNRLIRLNNLAVAYKDTKLFQKAINIYDSIITSHQAPPVEFARVLSNLAYTKWLQNKSYNAKPELQEALQIRRQINDQWGIQSSYSHLADYYLSTNADSAFTYANKMLSLSRELYSPANETKALEKLISLAPSDRSKSYFTRYQFLNDSLQTASNTAKNQFALIRYETEKSKTQNLVLQKDNAEKNTRLVINQAVIFVLVLLSVISYFWYRKRKQQALQKQQLKTSQKVHDVVANGLYRIMTKIEHQPDLEPELILDDLEELYEQSRNISYEDFTKNTQKTDDEITQLLKSFSTDTRKISIVGKISDTWNKLNTTQQTELRFVLEEIMINMKKHSGANYITIRFEDNHHQVKIQYIDDGCGLAPGQKYGNGLNNTVSRINSIGGQITFDSSFSQGLKILLIIPIP